ncbi:hypothetical protein [Clostridium chrysemydis]|uniref:hypothetical protein n=1 Tax=Clostridium chrysemydis TaxID=2665504 RepID=UPI001883483E|nr:hypothetical protein [Clostridium chrysemydis]
MTLDFILFCIVIIFGGISIYNYLWDKYELISLPKISRLESKVTFSIAIIYSIILLYSFYNLESSISLSYIGKSLAFFGFFVFLFYSSIKEKLTLKNV